MKNDKSMKERNVPDFFCSLLQVLLSGLIGVVSWKRPLSLVVSVHPSPTPASLRTVASLASWLGAGPLTRVSLNH